MNNWKEQVTSDFKREVVNEVMRISKEIILESDGEEEDATPAEVAEGVEAIFREAVKNVRERES